MVPAKKTILHDLASMPTSSVQEFWQTLQLCQVMN